LLPGCTKKFIFKETKGAIFKKRNRGNGRTGGKGLPDLSAGGNLFLGRADWRIRVTWSVRAIWEGFASKGSKEQYSRNGKGNPFHEAVKWSKTVSKWIKGEVAERKKGGSSKKHEY